jgi:2'-hydroxyisoflavone reductase
MRILALGGTRFVGRHVAEAALARGHDVTVLHRGKTGSGLFPAAEHLLADRDADLSVLAGRHFDATLDFCAYVPGQVDALAAALDGRGGQHLFVSTVSVYAPPDGPGMTESAPLHEPAPADVTEVTDQTYGPLKVACEQAAARHHGDGLLIIRPTYVVGPDDYTWRFPYWVWRMAGGGRVLCPGPADAPMQVIDARDQATFMLDLLDRSTAGVFHTVSPSPPFSFGDMLEAIAARVAPPGTTLEWLDEQLLLDSGLPESSLPLWSWGESDWWAGAADPSAAYAAGLTPRPLAQTVDSTLDWVRTTDGPRPGTGLSPAQEAELLARAG